MKVKKIIKNIFKWIGNIFIVFLVYLIINSIVSICNKKVPSIFNYNFFIVQTNSMEPTIKVDDLVISKKYDFASLRDDYDNDPTTNDGDIITFLCIDSSSPIAGEIITHRVVKIEFDENGKQIVTTKGDYNGANDTYKVTIDNYYGKVVKISSFSGKIVSFFYKSGFILIIAGISFVMFLMIFIQLKKDNTKKEVQETKDDYKEKLRKEILEELKQEGLQKKE